MAESDRRIEYKRRLVEPSLVVFSSCDSFPAGDAVVGVGDKAEAERAFPQGGLRIG